jgi:hypothetical protein
MANWGLVIGVDAYPQAPRLNLRGAVRDALAMAELLLEGPTPLLEGPERLLLLLSPAAQSPQPRAELPVYGRATVANITKAVREVAGKAGERLYVYFSGHGILAPGSTNGEAILPEEYEPQVTTQSIEVAGILAYLRTAGCREQFVFLDACRNVPFEGNFQVGRFAQIPEAGRVRPDVEQYVFLATSRGVTANELRMKENEEGGVFSGALVRGLRGEGAAKRYDPDGGRYLVTVGRLLEFVQGEVRETVRRLALAPEGAFPQAPRLGGEHGSTETVVRVVAAAGMPAVQMGFAVSPGAAQERARLEVIGDRFESTLQPPVAPGTRVAVPPGDYRVRGWARGYQAKRTSWAVEAYGDTTVALTFASGGAGEMAVGLAAGDDDFQPRPVSRLGEERRGALVARTLDPLGVVRVVDHRNRVKGEGRQRVELRELAPGVYRCQVLAPGGVGVEELVAVEAGEREEVLLDAPAGAEGGVMAELQRVGEIRVNRDRSLRVVDSWGEMLGAPAAALLDVPGLLAMAEAARLVGQVLAPMERVVRLGVELWGELAPDSPEAALQLTVADEEGGALRRATVRTWPVAGERPAAGRELGAGKAESVGWLAGKVEPGTHLLELEGAAGERLVMAAPVLAGWVTAVVLHRAGGGATTGSCFFLRERGGGEGDVLLQRRLRLAQRFLESGGYGEVLRVLEAKPGDADGKILGGQEDPMAELLRGYAQLRLVLNGEAGRREEFEATVAGWGGRFAELADAHVLAAEARRLAGEEAVAECRAALERGIPLFWFGAMRLLGMAQGYKLAQANLGLLAEAVVGRVGSGSLLCWRGE